MICWNLEGLGENKERVREKNDRLNRENVREWLIFMDQEEEIWGENAGEDRRQGHWY